MSNPTTDRTAEPSASAGPSTSKARLEANLSSSIHQQGELEDEWEYEYSTTETESVYFSLDLTSHVPPEIRQQMGLNIGKPRVKRQRARESRGMRGKKKTNADAADADDDDDDDEIEGDEDELDAPQSKVNSVQELKRGRGLNVAQVGPGRPFATGKTDRAHLEPILYTDPNEKGKTTATQDDVEEGQTPRVGKQNDNSDFAARVAEASAINETYLGNDRIQILELASENPIINYRNQYFSCSWATAVGTDMFFQPTPNTTSATPASETGTSGAPTATGQPSAASAPGQAAQPFKLLPPTPLRLVAYPLEIEEKVTNEGPGFRKKGGLMSERRGRPSRKEGTLHSLDAATYNPEIAKQQQEFLKELQELKRKRGDPDAERVPFQTFERFGKVGPLTKARPAYQAPTVEDADDNEEEGSDGVVDP